MFNPYSAPLLTAPQSKLCSMSSLTSPMPQPTVYPPRSSLVLTNFQSFFGAMGCAAAIVFTCFGASYGMAKSSIGIMASSILRPDLIVRSMLFPYLLYGYC